MGNICNVARHRDAVSRKQVAALRLTLMIMGRWKMDSRKTLLLSGNQSKDAGINILFPCLKTRLSRIQTKSSWSRKVITHLHEELTVLFFFFEWLLLKMLFLYGLSICCVCLQSDKKKKPKNWKSGSLIFIWLWIITYLCYKPLK